MVQCQNRDETKPAMESDMQIKEGVRITDGWARPTKAGRMSAAYFTLENGYDTADTLVAARSNVAENTQIHLSYKNADGLMAMEEQEFVPVPAQNSVEFKQGGLHIMLIQPEKDLQPGDSVRVTLAFVSGKEISAFVPVREPSN
jgi:copper(I)-binding protein